MSFLIPNFFLPHFPEAITSLRVNKFSIFLTDSENLGLKLDLKCLSQVNLTTVGGVRAKTKKVRWESGVSEAEIEIAHFPRDCAQTWSSSLFHHQILILDPFWVFWLIAGHL